MLRFFLFLLLLVAQVACSPEHRTSATFPDKSSYKLSELGFSTIQNRVLRPSCTGCHGTGGGVNLETYENVKRNLPAIQRSVFVTQRMPKAPVPALTPSQLGVLNAWVEAGAPEAAPEEEPALPPLSAEFESLRVNILIPKCQSCHAPGKAVARIPLINKEDLLDSPLELVIPGNAEESGLMIAITRVDLKKLMPPPLDAQGNPTGYERLSDAEIEAVRAWIEEGAKN